MRIRDTNGRESITATVTVIAAHALILRFVFGGFFGMPIIGAEEFGIGFAAVMAVWLGREWREVHYNSKGGE